MNRALQVIPNKIDKSILILPDLPFFSLIWLHGLGDSPAGFLDYFQIPQSPAFMGARVNLLHAPLRKVTINGGAKSNSWYDIRHLGGSGSDQERFNMEEVKDSLAIIDAKVKAEVEYWKERGIKDSEEQILKRIFIGGFSQGCAMSLTYGLTSDRILGGVIAFSGHLFQSIPLKNKGIVPILAYHGNQDDVLNYKWVKPMYDRQFKDIPNFKFRLVPDLDHSITLEQLSQSTNWMLEQLNKQGIKL